MPENVHQAFVVDLIVSGLGSAYTRLDFAGREIDLVCTQLGRNSPEKCPERPRVGKVFGTCI